MKEKKKLRCAEDDGRTIADMSAEWMPWNHGWGRSKAKKRTKQDREKIKITKAEKRAITRGAFLAMLPMLLTVLAVFAVMILLAYLWLMP